MKLLLISIHPCRSPQSVPLAPAFLKGAIQADPVLNRCVSPEIVEFVLQEESVTCAEAILARQPEAVAFSVYVWNREQVAAIALHLKSRSPSLRLFAGGAEPTANPHPLLSLGCFDALVRGEGEVSFPELLRRVLQGLPLEGVPGLIVPGAPAAGALSPAPDLNLLGSPYLEGLLDPAAAGGALWQLSRGCDFACAFCFDHKGAGGVRRFPLPRLERELALFAAAGVPQVFVLDSTFNKIPERAKEILRLIARLAPQVHFHFEVRSEFIDAEMADLFAGITCSLQIGLQSSDRGVLAEVGRSFDAEQFASRIALLNQSGAVFGFDLIFGLPGDSLKRFRASLDYALSLYPNHLDIFPLAVLPGTRLFGRSGKLGLVHLDAPPYTVISTPSFTSEDLAQAAALGEACDIFYSRGKAVAWFNGVLRALKLTPSSFLAAFASWLKSQGKGGAGEEGVSDAEIWGLQRAFLEELFTARRKERLLPLALDLADYHHHYAAALLAAPPQPPSRKALRKLDLWQAPLALSPSATLARFHYEILEILEAGEPELDEFASEYGPTGSCAVIYPYRGEICTESLSLPYYQLLEALDGTTTAATLSARFSIPRADACSLLEFALGEGIVTLSR